MAEYYVDIYGNIKKKEDETDGYPVSDTSSGLEFFKKAGVFSDGYQFGDVTSTVLGTVGDVGLNISKGILGVSEGIGDLLLYGASGVASLFGADDAAAYLKNEAQINSTENITRSTSDLLDQYSVLGRTIEGIAQGVGQVGLVILSGGIGGAAGLGSAGVTALTTGMMGLSGAGSGMSEAYNSGADDGEAVAYGLTAGAIDAASEMLFGGLGKAINAVGISKGIGSVDDIIAKGLSKKFKSQLTKNLVEYGVKSGAEGLEEVIAGYGQAVAKKMTYLSEKELDDIVKDENLLEQFLVGTLTSSLAQGGDLVKANKSGTDFITGLTPNEQKVVDRETEKRIAAREEGFEFVSTAAEQKNTTVDSSGVQYSISRTITMPWKEQINGALHRGGNIKRNDTLVVGNVSEFLTQDNVSQKPLAIPLSVISKAISGKDASHAISDENLGKLDVAINKAPIVIDNPARNSLVYITDIQQDGKPVIVSFQKDAEFDGDNVHKATSIHLRMDVGEMLNALPSEATVYVQNKNELSDAVGVTNSLRSLAADVKFIDNTLSQSSDVVKTQNSVSEKSRDATKANKKLTAKERNAIAAQVMKDIDKGYISIDTIEEALGGDTYQSYRDAVANEDALIKEYEDLLNTEEGKFTVGQRERLNELKEQIADARSHKKSTELKTKLGDDVFHLVKDGRLAESYNEKARQGQAFEADVTTYDKKQQAVIQEAIDSGILNNTNKTHEFVDLLAKLSADKGIAFHFADNAKLKESGFAIEGKTINGVKNADGITINTQSAKYLNAVVGHEITHVLEGTDLYGALQTALFDYAKTKGDYDSRRADIESLYVDIQDADIDGELTADLVGDYLFTDADFINHLLTQDRNLFQKIFDEINYLCKVATGNKEAKELAKVKRLFEQAYKQNGTGQNTENQKNQYHISDNFSKEIDDTLNGNMPKSSQVKARDYTPQILVENGVNDLPMLMTQKHIKTTVYTKEQAEKLGLPTGKGYNYHGLGKDLLVKSVDSMDTPSVIYKKDNDHFVIVTEFYDTDGNNVIIPIKIDGKGSYNDVYIDENQILSVYGKHNLEKYIQENGFEKIYEKRETTLNEGVQYSNIGDFSTNNIPNSEPNVNNNVEISKNAIAPIRQDGSTQTRDVHGFTIADGTKVNEDLLEELHIHHPDAQVDAQGNVTVYHRTTKENAEAIRRTGIMTAKEDALFFSSKDSGYASDYGDTVVALKIPSTELQVNDIFDGEVHFDMPLSYKNGQFSKDVSAYLVDNTQLSISTPNTPSDAIGDYHVSGQDVSLNKVIAPMREDVDNSQDNQPKRIVLNRQSDLYREVKESGRSPSAVIREHIIRNFVGKEITFSDGRVAIVDKTDAKELSKRAGEVKTAEVAQLQEIIDNAVLYKTGVNAEHNKFKSFSYYKATVELDEKPFDILLNVGFGKFDGKEHLYAITDFDKKRTTAETMSLAGSEDNLLKSDSSIYSIPEQQSLVNEKNTAIAPIGDNVKLSVSADTTMDAPMREDVAPDGVVVDEDIAPLPGISATDRPIAPLPNGNEGKRKQRQWVETSTESPVVNREILPDDLDQDQIYYTPVSNAKSTGRAKALYDAHGYEKSVEYFNSKIADGRVSLDDVVLGERLISEAIQRGDRATAGELIQNVSILGTELGQKVQALSIIRRMTPEGQLKMLDKVVNRGKVKQDPAFEGVEVTDEMRDKILSVYNQDGTFDQDKLNATMEEVKQEIADEMGITKLEKANAWRYLAMLGNPKTHNRNILSNVAMLCTGKVKNAVARTAETIGHIENRTKTWKRATDTVKEFAEQTADDMKDIISGDSKYSEPASLKQKRQIFKTKLLNGLYEFNSNMLEKEDWWFSKHAFKSAFSEFLTANGIETEQDIQANPELVNKGKMYAVEQAQIATFRQYSYLASKISEIERKNAATNVLVGAIMPFKKTPINIAKTGLAYSPLGLAKSLTYDVHQMKKGNMEASQLIDNMSQGVTGTVLSILGYILASTGFLSGAGEDDKEGKYDYQLGEQTYSINIGGKSYSLSWLSPVAMPLFVGANAYEILEQQEEWNGDVVVQTLAQTLDPLSEMSFVSGLTDVLSSYDNGTMAIAGSAQSMAQNYVTQYVPTLLSQVAQAMDDKKRSTKASANSGFTMFEETINKIKYKIPWLRQTLEPSLDIWGNEIKQSENPLQRVLETFVAPYNIRDNIRSQTDEEIKALYRETGETSLIPSNPDNYVNFKDTKYTMSSEEYTQFKKSYGQGSHYLLEKLFATSTYQNASAEDKVALVKDVYERSRDEAKKALLAKRGVQYTNATKDGVPYYKENAIVGAIAHDMMPEEYTLYATDNGKYQVVRALGGIKAYKIYSKMLNDITSDKYASGKTVQGSRKKKVAAYISGLDIGYGEKILLYKSMYPADDTYNRAIVQYLNGRDDISFEDEVALLRELGFTVSNNGHIRW